MKLYVITLGCPKNRVDTEFILGSLKSSLSHLELVNSCKESDVILINTCSFIKDAVEESIDTILETASEKSNDQPLIVTGCLVERYGVKTLKKEMPEVDHFLGFKEIQHLPKILNNSPPIKNQCRILSTPPWRAYLKISEGCSNRCTYCLIPKIRGPQECRPPDSILKEAKELVKNGVKEITLVAQDLTAYQHQNSDLADLLNLLAKSLKQTWLRLLYLYPSRINNKLLETIAAHPNICPYFDIPIQHTSDPILKKMGRQYTQSDILATIASIKAKISSAYFRTSIIVGFPGETEQDFQNLKDIIKQIEFDHLGCFIYSDEDEAPSSRLPDKVNLDIAKARQAEIMELQQHISNKKNKKLIGTVQDVLVEGYSDETDLLLVGRTKYQAPEIDGQVFINDGFANSGDVVKVKITDSYLYDLIGKILSPSSNNSQLEAR